MTKKIFPMPSARDIKRAQKEKEKKDRQARQGLEKTEALQAVEARLAVQRAAELDRQRKQSEEPRVPRRSRAASQTVYIPRNEILFRIGAPPANYVSLKTNAGALEKILQEKTRRPVHLIVIEQPVSKVDLGVRLLHLLSEGMQHLAGRNESMICVQTEIISLREADADPVDAVRVCICDRQGLMVACWLADGSAEELLKKIPAVASTVDSSVFSPNKVDKMLRRQILKGLQEALA